ncbi:hypothetical protein CEE44_02315 [Candidatus Woesearchaeota archaeon B3_Woes]|nr:MAG: hypothetical protein CEE44_02315 [Candidatus Woesearchaeota archaeon B3_Woes]
MDRTIKKYYDKFKKFEKHFIYFLYIFLFVILVIYSIKYFSILSENIKKIGFLIIFVIFLIQILIVYFCDVRIYYLLKPLNKKKIRVIDLFLVFNISNLFKYVPPKGINYYMRIKLLNKIKNLQGKITSTFGEFVSEIYISSICTLILIYNILETSLFLKLSILLFIVLATYFMLFPYYINKILNLLKLKLKKIRKLIFHFTKLVRYKEYYYSLFLTLITAILHGFSLYMISSSIGLSQFSIFEMTIVFYSAQFLSILLMAPAGIGVRDIGITSFLVFNGVDIGNAIFISLLHRAIMFISELVIGLVSIIWLKSKDSFSFKNV